MARYIDADKVMEEINRIGGHNLCEWETIGVKALIDRQPTVDVAPKSEVARAFRQRMNEKMGKHTHLLGKEYVQRIMREIEKEFTEEKE